jgi:hypothetical protein
MKLDLKVESLQAIAPRSRISGNLDCELARCHVELHDDLTILN